mgnify:CR=1 FL=1
MLKVGGIWVAPAEVEAAPMEHPAVLEAAVIGRADGDGLTRPHAFCILKDGAHGDDALRDALRATVKQRLAGYKAPRWIEIRGRPAQDLDGQDPALFACASDPRAGHRRPGLERRIATRVGREVPALQE